MTELMEQKELAEIISMSNLKLSLLECDAVASYVTGHWSSDVGHQIREAIALADMVSKKIVSLDIDSITLVVKPRKVKMVRGMYQLSYEDMQLLANGHGEIHRSVRGIGWEFQAQLDSNLISSHPVVPQSVWQRRMREDAKIAERMNEYPVTAKAVRAK